MLIAKGYGIRLTLTSEDGEGRTIVLPAHLQMLHDPHGEYWPRNSILFAPFSGSGEEIVMDGDQREYFGRRYRARIGTAVGLPPVSLDDGWRSRGDVSDIYYNRGGVRAPGYYHHAFRAPSPLWGGAIGGLMGAAAGALTGAAVGSAGAKKWGWPAGLLLGAFAGSAVIGESFPHDPPAELFERGGRYRLELPKLSIVNWRGFLLP